MAGLCSTVSWIVIFSVMTDRCLMVANSDTDVNSTQRQLNDTITTATIIAMETTYLSSSKSPGKISTAPWTIPTKQDFGETITKTTVPTTIRYKSSSLSTSTNKTTTELSQHTAQNTSDPKIVDTTGKQPITTTDNMVIDTNTVSKTVTITTNYSNLAPVSETPESNETGSGITSQPRFSTQTTNVTGQKDDVTTQALKTTSQKMDSSDHTPDGMTGENWENITDTGRITWIFDNFDGGDKLWPIGMALTIGIPTIIVLAVTITVLYRRQVAKPRSRMSFYGQNYAKM